MHTEWQFKQLWIRRRVTLISTMSLGVVSTFGLIGILAFIRNQVINPRNEWLNFLLILASVAPIPLAAWLADVLSKQFYYACPNCKRDLSQSYERVIKTRSCIECNCRVLLGGKQRTRQTYSRYCSRKWRCYLIYWFWAWPISGLAMLAYHSVSPDAFRNCPHMIFLFGLLGVTSAGWTFLRTFDRRYIPQLVASSLVLVLGLQVFLS